MQSARWSFLFPRKIKQTEPQAQSQKKQRRKQEKRKLINNWGYENAMKMDGKADCKSVFSDNKQTNKKTQMTHNKQPKAIKEHFIGGWNTFQPTKVQGSEDRNVEKG